MKVLFPCFYALLLRRKFRTTVFPFSSMAEFSDLSCIEIKDSSHPSTLFNEWVNEAKLFGIKLILMNLATSTKNGKVSNRTVVIRDIMPDASLAFMTQLRSNKLKDINENPQVAATVLLIYNRDDESVTRQVRFKGVARKLSKEQCKVYFDRDGLPGKIRSWICNECKPCDWNDLKAKHDALLKEVVENKKVLDVPDTQVAYKIVPNEMDFYSSIGDSIADRILFEQDDSGKWKYERIMT